MRFCMNNHFCAREDGNRVVAMVKCFAPLRVGYVKTDSVMRYCVANYFLCSCVHDRVCMDQASAANYYSIIIIIKVA